MKIYSPDQLSELDQLTIKEKQISSHQLMQTAAEKASDLLLEQLDENQKIYLFCGIGNNAGDGFAMAKIFLDQGFNVEVFILKYADNLSHDAQLNYDILEDEITIQEVSEAKELPDFENNPVVIDAIFGVGLNRELPNFVQEVISFLNKTEAYKVAIDCPSGLYAHQANQKKDVVFNADLTLTFHAPKLSFLFSDFGNKVGEMKILDIGLLQKHHLKSEYNYIDQKFIKSIFKKRETFSHKGTYGHLVLVGGQKGMFGSVMLSAKAAMRSGVGKLTILCPPKAVEMLNITLPEAMTIESDHENFIAYQEFDFSYQTIGIGMGVGTSENAFSALKNYLEKTEKPILIDADGLNLISQNKDLLQLLPAKSVLTPHIGELKRLIGEWSNSFEMLDKAKSFSKKHDCILVVKEAFTKVIYHDKVYMNSTGNAGLATAGSGDVLAGIISGLIAQSYTSLQASILGVYLHGLSADLYVDKFSVNSLIASDLIDYLGNTFYETEG
ncbi:NAD(P)H-hydrate dehydratase [Psychroflexus halocasei]|uniref:Bifunctional NAD(P)H-hydrate repair enzyme n=1 Tax=Psychroflexus halocasei TaxID=908615 RepID=A0A1H4DLG2_9FLAO|nr:NAD(P)H-hydrate dehydratase [Psychroflexus halocasei]SEA73595.1 yjeF C-terminal region, hydroxyethylthiazole kinase-related/yjeF N-terminal region [Psychroflexus halocasei]